MVSTPTKTAAEPVVSTPSTTTIAAKPELTCPSCSSTDVSRSQRVDWQEKATCWLRRVLPYRCRKCDRRFYGRKPAN